MKLVTDRETLVAALTRHGVDWLAPSDAIGGEGLEPHLLIASLAAHADPRLRAALTGLFILRPEVSAFLSAALRELNSEARDELTARYMAAVYLQRLWRTRLALYLGEFPDLPPLVPESLGLPGAGHGYGKIGLHALAHWHQRRSPAPYNRLAEYNRQMEHVIAALKMREHRHEPAAAG